MCVLLLFCCVRICVCVCVCVCVRVCVLMGGKKRGVCACVCSRTTHSYCGEKTPTRKAYRIKNA